ncbi:MAG: radical SAM family heme chaperone HemW [Sphingomonadaceae bacterium]
MDSPIAVPLVPGEVEGRLLRHASAARQAGDERSSSNLALYIHWPFCISKCPYCDFNSHVRRSVDEAAWRGALLADLAHEAALLPGRRLGSIFFGGGTPSLMPPATVAALIDAAAGHWEIASDIEITLEANPSSAEASRFAGLATAGVNRVSLGLQSLDDGALAFLGRAHDAAEGLAALDAARRHFERLSFDLIYALPGQGERAWRDELRRALAWGAGHASLYQLTIEPGTRFSSMVRRGELAPADPDRAAALYEATQELCDTAGLPAYEISNHSRPGEESRHNLNYWRYRDYAGIGPGAHGRRGGKATERHKKPENFLAAVRAHGHGLSREEPLVPAERAAEALLMGLRLSEGVDLERIAALGEAPAAALVDLDRIGSLAERGLLRRQGSRIAVTAEGRLLTDAILAAIVR